MSAPARRRHRADKTSQTVGCQVWIDQKQSGCDVDAETITPAIASQGLIVPLCIAG